MIRDLTTQLHNYSMTWKPSSLLYMVCGVPLSLDSEGQVPHSLDLVIQDFSEPIVPHTFRRVLSLDVLGCEVSAEHNTCSHQDVAFRVEKARRAFYSQASYFKCQSIPLKNKFYRYQERVQSLALSCCEGTTIDNYSVGFLDCFEGQCLRCMMRFAKKENESDGDF